ncbi:MAG: extracellular solute-binding protein, partial [Beijerinckiaceae bacterium]
MKRRTFLQLTGAAAAASALARPALAQGQTTIRWWYHFDNPQNTPAALIAKFEAANPGIKVQAEAIPWGGGNDYSTRLFASIVANNAPDCAQVKLNNHARLLEMDALTPLDDMLKGWAGRADIAD